MCYRRIRTGGGRERRQDYAVNAGLTLVPQSATKLNETIESLDFLLLFALMTVVCPLLTD
jgi:hypothetical protein